MVTIALHLHRWWCWWVSCRHACTLHIGIKTNKQINIMQCLCHQWIDSTHAFHAHKHGHTVKTMALRTLQGNSCSIASFLGSICLTDIPKFIQSNQIKSIVSSAKTHFSIFLIYMVMVMYLVNGHQKAKLTNTPNKSNIVHIIMKDWDRPNAHTHKYIFACHT